MATNKSAGSDETVKPKKKLLEYQNWQLPGVSGVVLAIILLLAFEQYARNSFWICFLIIFGSQFVAQFVFTLWRNKTAR